MVKILYIMTNIYNRGFPLEDAPYINNVIIRNESKNENSENR